MIMKDRTIPLKILILVAILRRLPWSHAKFQKIKEELARRLAGFEGEKSLDFYFRELPKEKYLIFHDLNLPDCDYNCQIDTLLLTPEFALIIDVKHMAGKLIFDTDNEQFIQINNEKEKGYPYPIAQAERHQKHIKKLLAEHHFPDVPVEYLVVLSNGYSTYVVTGKNASRVKARVCKADILLKRIEAIENMYSKPHISSKDLRKFSRLLVKLNTPPTKYLLQKYGIQKSEIKPGVHCPLCDHLPLKREKQKWFCPCCEEFFVDAHVEALKDYFLLFDLKITNREFREFAQIKSIDTAKRLLLSANLNYSGEKKSRYYFPKSFPW